MGGGVGEVREKVERRGSERLMKELKAGRTFTVPPWEGCWSVLLSRLHLWSQQVSANISYAICGSSGVLARFLGACEGFFEFSP